MAVVCSCLTQPGNTGTPNCKTLAKTASMIIVVKRFADDGTQNRILLSDTLNQAYFDALFQHADPSKRWYPIAELESVLSERAEAIIQTYDSGTIKKIQDAQKNFTSLVPEVEYAYFGKVKQNECLDIGIYIVDIDSQLKGQLSSDGLNLDTMEISNGSWDARYSEATDTKVAEMMVNFQFAKSVKDEDLRLITPGEMDNVDLLQSTGLKDVNGVYSSITVTTVTAALTLDYSSPITPLTVDNLVFGDFIVRGVSTGTPFAVSAAPEAPDGTYAIVFATAPGGGAVYQLEVPPAKGFSPIVVGTFVIP